MTDRSIVVIALLFVCLTAVGQSEKYQRYISKYKPLAIDQMRKHKIPASITMAQGLLESGAGTSTLAIKANNHFGIKCHRDWKGPYVLKTDDAPNERFRAYKSVEDSYEDHSQFLVRGQRYASLFKLPIKDYKAWARGLKAAGYATSPTYAQNLIRIIELYKLHELDNAALSKHHFRKDDNRYDSYEIAPAGSSVSSAAGHAIGLNNHTYYVIATVGDTYKSLAREFETSERRLRKYNEVDKHYVLKAGDIVYLQKKQKRAHKSLKNKYHMLQPGESLYLVSQKYGVRIKNLYKTNRFSSDHTPVVGEKIRLR